MTSLALAAVVLSGTALGLQGRLLVDESDYRVGKADVIHVVVDPPAGVDADTIEVTVTVEGPSGVREITETIEPGGKGPQLVTLPWTPRQAGEHVLVAESQVGELHVAQEETVHVSQAPSASSRSDGWTPETAPGTVQWAIAFGVLFFFARAGLTRTS